ncbi:uncharacterized protein L201_004469 [Kwoniella dendrophila CBS 6074]|uniref:Holocytochrome c-type synthase n=1 Tax=Kwoniella dendrophila CBS 6074 TaxID=1295534 RepID=A0AAX4JVU8_9TREE
MWPFTSTPPEASSSSRSTSTPTPVSGPVLSEASADKCPVDHSTRAAWLATQSSDSTTPHPFHPSSASASSSGSSNKNNLNGLSQDRVISSIPRASLPLSSASFGYSDSSSDDNTTGPPKEAGHAQPEIKKDSEGKWIYPSEQQFFNAMMRKKHNPQIKDMKTVVPIHNAVNEKAWEQILLWESNIEGSEKCGGPKLISFIGKPKEKSPKAWIKTALGYTPPFDRHDWLIDRCGTQVRYVIDFYTGKSGTGQDASKMSFYLDVRPAVDNWEGIKTRAAGWWNIP